MEKAYWLSTEEAKEFFCVIKFDVRRNTKTGKLSILLPDGVFLKIQQDLDPTLPTAFITTAVDEFGDPNWYEGCLINVKEQASEFTL
jgi:hypothetical protein